MGQTITASLSLAGLAFSSDQAGRKRRLSHRSCRPIPKPFQRRLDATAPRAKAILEMLAVSIPGQEE
jgi:hypothetical protein